MSQQPTQPSSSSADTSALISQARLLLVDDSVAFSRLAQAMLRKIGFPNVAWAGTIADAMRELENAQTPFDLILMDVNLPDGDGTDACAHLSARAGLRDVPIVIITGNNDNDVIQKAFASGGSDFIAKPLNGTVLRARLGAVLRQRRLFEITRQQERHLSRIFEVMTEGLIDITPDFRIQRANRRARTLLNLAESDLNGPDLYSLLAPRCSANDGLDEFRQKLCHAGFAAADLTIDTEENEQRLITLLGAKVDLEASDCGAVVAVRDVTEQRMQLANLHHQAFHDPLTGLPNRMLFSDRFEQAINRSTRSHHLLGLLYMDLDNFKTLNDTLGHDAGDQALRTTAQIMTRELRESDTMARLGGDEFVVLLSDASDAQAIQATAQRLRDAMAEPLDFDGQPWQLGTSIGVAIYPTDGDTPETLMAVADHRMYQEKRARKQQDW